MHDHLLDDIIQLEKTLQRDVEKEKALIRSWLVQERYLLEPAAQQIETIQSESCAAEVAKAQRTAEREAAVHKAIVEQRCDRIVGMPSEWLTEHLKHHLQELLPEGGNDRQDGEG